MAVGTGAEGVTFAEALLRLYGAGVGGGQVELGSLLGAHPRTDDQVNYSAQLRQVFSSPAQPEEIQSIRYRASGSDREVNLDCLIRD